MSTAASPSETKPRRIGPYLLLKPLGKGASGTVFLAEHKDLGQRVAIKVMRPDQEPGLVDAARSEKATRLARFVREGRTLARLSRAGHPGIVRVIDCRRNQAQTRAYLVMEYVDGVSLHEWQCQHSAESGQSQPAPVPTDIAIDIVLQIAEALCFVHEQGVVHRDVKPANIIVRVQPDPAMNAPNQPKQAVTLVDFGIAKVPPSLASVTHELGTARSLTTISTVDGALLGTVGYMAPEQCRGQQVTDRADVYALGVILFELLAGDPPFKGQSPVELLIQHAEHSPPSLAAFAAQRGVTVPRWLSELVAAMLDKDPTQRPAVATIAATLRTPPAIDACPLPGLSALQSTDVDLLVGRSQDASLVAGWIQRAATSLSAESADNAAPRGPRWIVVAGSAGVGKTSFVQAALPSLLRGTPSRPAWHIESLDTAPHSLSEWLSKHDNGPMQPTLLVVDHVERLLSGSDAETSCWADALTTILALPSPVVVLTVVRRDAMARLTGLPALRQFDREVCPLSPLTPAMMGEAVSAICRRGRIRLAEGLPDRIVKDALATSVPLGLLQLFFQLLWRRRGSGPLSLTDYEQMVGSSGLVRFLSESIEADLGRLTPAQQDCARRIMLALVWPGRGLPDTRRTRSRLDLLRAAGSSTSGEATLRQLCGEGTVVLEGPPLLVSSSDGDLSALTLVHDAVLTEVPVVAGWITTDRPSLEYLAHVEELAADWARAGKPAGDLPQGTLLTQYTNHRTLLAQAGSSLVQEFVAAALSAEQHRRRRTLWLRMTLAGAFFAVTITAGLAWKERAVAVTSARQAADARDRASEHLRQVLGSVEQISADTDWDLAVLPDPSGSLFEARRSLLESAEARLRDVSEEDLERPGVRVARIRVRQRLADFAFAHIDLMTADQWLQRARDDIDMGLRSPQQRDELMLLDALTWSKQGKVAQARGQRDAAVRAFERSLYILRQLHAAQGGRRGVSQGDLLLSLATSSQELGLARLYASASSSDQTAGVRLLTEAIGLYGQAGTMSYHQGLAADTKLHLVEHAIRQGRLAEAKSWLNEARDTHERLLRESPTHMGWRTSLLRGQRLRAQLLLAEGHQETAGATLVDAAADGRKFLLDQPGDKRHRGQFLTVAEIWVNLSDYHQATGASRAAALMAELCRFVDPLALVDPDREQIIRIRNYSCSQPNRLSP